MFRMSQALYALAKPKGDFSSAEMRTVVEYAEKALKGNPSDAKIKEFCDLVKKEYKGKESFAFTAAPPRDESYVPPPVKISTSSS